MPEQKNTEIPGLSLRKVLGLSSIYGITPILDRVLALAFLPIFTRYLTPNAYGSLVLLYAFASIVQLVLFMGFPDSLQKLYWDYKGEERREFLGTAWLFNLFVNAVLLVPLVVFSQPISQYLLQNTTAAFLLMLVLAKLFFATQSIVPYVVFRAEEKKAKILSVNLASIIVRTGLTALFLMVFKMDLLGIFLADICASVATLFIYLPALRKMASFRFKVHYLKAIFKLAPFQFTVEMLAWVISLSDRLIMQKILKTASEVGIYAVGYTFGSAIVFLVNPILSAWRPYVYFVNSRSPGEYAGQMGQFFTYFFAVCAGAFLFFAAVSPDIIKILTPQIYHRAGTLVVIVLAAQICATISNYFLPTFFINHQVQRVAVVYAIAAAANFGFNLWLIPKMGIVGAAWATLIAYGLMAGLLWHQSQRLMPISFKVLPISLILLFTTGIWLVSGRINYPQPWVSLAFKSAFVIPFMVIPLWKFYRVRKKSYIGRDR
jgi:O-antigen/teichoic acid export membrane protein